jgi:glycosyltransferase involved in cell wall biosynthesis
VEIAEFYGSDRVKFVPITEAEVTWLGPWTTYFKRKYRAFKEWTLLNRYATALQSTECLIMYFDTFQLSSVLRRKLPCPFSGLYFRARFHYGEFQPNPLTWKDNVRHWQERFHISQVLRHPQLKTLFSLDGFAVKYLKQTRSHGNIVYLPDPIQIYSHEDSKVQALKTSLGIEPGRMAFLLFGVIDSRKGIHQVLEAIETLPKDLCKKLCLLLVGTLNPTEKPQIQAKIAKLTHLLPVQVVTHDQFVIDREIQPYFQIADVVLATYQRHVGTSSILIRAAAAQKPVLSTNYGLMGEWTRHNQLGLTVDSALPSEIAKGLSQFLSETSREFFDQNKAKAFAEANSATKYASTIFNSI